MAEPGVEGREGQSPDDVPSFCLALRPTWGLLMMGAGKGVMGETFHLTHLTLTPTPPFWLLYKVI